MTNLVVFIHPDTDDLACCTWSWTCHRCETTTPGHRTSRVALADSEDHACPADPLIVGQESLFGGSL